MEAKDVVTIIRVIGRGKCQCPALMLGIALGFGANARRIRRLMERNGPNGYGASHGRNLPKL
jgi:hypothetical protein